MKTSRDKSSPAGRAMRYALGAVLAAGTLAALLRLLMPSGPAPQAGPAPVIENPIAGAPQGTRPVAAETAPAAPAAPRHAPRPAPVVAPVAPQPARWPLPVATKRLLGSLASAAPPSDAVRSIIGAGPDRENQKARRAAINKLTAKLTGADMAALLDFLLTPHRAGSGVTPECYNVLRNDILEILLRQETMPDGLGGLMVAMQRNPGEDPAWRDYSIQYMAEYYSRRWSPDSGIKDDPDGRDERTQMLAAYRDAFSHTGETLAGTALLGFERLSRQYPEIPAGEAVAAALRIATQPTMSSASRLTALRLCANLGQQEALSAARELAQIGQTTPLRMAAIATIGDLGTPEDLPLLSALSGATEPGIARIANAAHTRLTGKLAPKQQDPT